MADMVEVDEIKRVFVSQGDNPGDLIVFETEDGEVVAVPTSGTATISESRPSGMRWWDTRVAGREEDDGNINLLVVSDSSAEGWTASTLDKTYVRRFGKDLAELFGMGEGKYFNAAPGFAGYPLPSHNVWVTAGGWINSTGGSLGLCNRWAYTATNGAYKRLTTEAEQFKVYFLGSHLTGNARIYIDGVLAATFNTLGNTTGTIPKVWTSAELAPGAHTIEIQNNGAGSFIVLDGILAIEKVDNSVNVFNASHAGYSMPNYLAMGASWDTAVASTEAETVLIILGLNDESAGLTPVQVGNNYESLAEKLKGILGNHISICIVIEWANSNDVPGTWDPYAKELRKRSAVQGWGVIDIDAVVGYTAGDPYLLMPDTVHPNDRGSRLWADVIVKYLAWLVMR